MRRNLQHLLSSAPLSEKFLLLTIRDDRYPSLLFARPALQNFADVALVRNGDELLDINEVN